MTRWFGSGLAVIPNLVRDLGFELRVLKPRLVGGALYCRVEEWPVTLGIHLAASAVSGSCPFRLTIALLHSLPHETVDEACLP